tara:strand:- start:547 stop:1671 length:1125 start_codon:yes stop_codon:yes gene_type:complete
VDPQDSFLTSYDYELPSELIAQEPLNPRHKSRLMVVKDGSKDEPLIKPFKVWDIQDELDPGDLIVLNDTRVLKARLRVRLSSGAKGELLILEPLDNGQWLCLAKPAKRMRPGDRLQLEAVGQESIELNVIGNDEMTGGRVIQFPLTFSKRETIENLLNRYGEVPLPPYIRRHAATDDDRYQTRFASCPGAVAAPTAGLHLSDDLLEALNQKGVLQAKITLHVGLGTFRPLDVEDLTGLELHSEWVDVSEKTVKAIEDCHSRGGRVFAIGTTCVRALESAYKLGGKKLQPISCKVDLVIKPGYRFGVIDGLLTNFHLPKSSLLLLVSALIGRSKLMLLYKKAVKQNYRFFSYGDAMLITPEAVLTSARNQALAGS